MQRTKKVSPYQLSNRDFELLQTGIKAGVSMALEAIQEFHTGKISNCLEDGAMATLNIRGIPRKFVQTPTVQEGTARK